MRADAVHRKGAIFTVRLAPVTPTSAEEFRDAIVDEIESLDPGARVVATTVPIAGGDAIDLLAADGRGRLLVVTFCLDADGPGVWRALEKWDRFSAQLGLLRALTPSTGIDLSQNPRLMMVTGAVSDDARRAAGLVDLPEVELVEATLVAAGGTRGILLRRVPASARRPASAGLDDLLSGLPAGEPRSLGRRLLEELRDRAGTTAPLEARRLRGGIDLTCGGRLVATLVEGASGVEVRPATPDGARTVLNDMECSEAARMIDSLVRRPAGGDPEPARPRDHGPAAEALTPEEIAEFGRPGPSPSGLQETNPAEPELPAVRIAKTGFMEN